jgi:hypothetical protein
LTNHTSGDTLNKNNTNWEKEMKNVDNTSFQPFKSKKLEEFTDSPKNNFNDDLLSGNEVKNNNRNNQKNEKKIENDDFSDLIKPNNNKNNDHDKNEKNEEDFPEKLNLKFEEDDNNKNEGINFKYEKDNNNKNNNKKKEKITLDDVDENNINNENLKYNENNKMNNITENQENQENQVKKPKVEHQHLEKNYFISIIWRLHFAAYLMEFIGTFMLTLIVSLTSTTPYQPLAIGASLATLIFLGNLFCVLI